MKEEMNKHIKTKHKKRTGVKQIKLKLKPPKAKDKTIVKLTNEDFERFNQLDFSERSINHEIDRLIERRMTERKQLWDYIAKKYNIAKDRPWHWTGKKEIFIDDSREAKNDP